MSEASIYKLNTCTKLFIFALSIAATELDSHAGVYVAMCVWLWQEEVIKIEQSILEYINKVK